MEHPAGPPTSVGPSPTPAERTLGGRAVSGMIWSLVEQWGSQVLASAVFVVLARLVAPKAFGLVALAGVFVAFANVFLGQGFAQAVIAQRPLRKDHVDTAFWTNTALGATLAAVGIGCAPLVAHLQGDGDIRPVLQALSLNFLLGALGGIPEAMLQRDLQFRSLSVRTLISNVVADVLGVTLAVAGAGVWALVAQTVAQTALDSLILWVVSPRRPGLQVTRAALRDMRNFGLNVTGLNVLNLLNRQSDNFLVGVYLGPVKLGFYSVAYQILSLFETSFIGTIQVVMFPVFASVSDDRKRLNRAFEMASRATAIIAFPAFVGLALVSRQMIPLVFGDKWTSAVPVAQVLAFIGIVHAMSQFNGQVCKAVGRVGIVVRFTALNTVVNVAGFFVAVHFGIFWVAVAYVARGYLLYPLSILMVHTALNHDVARHLRGFLAPITATAAMAGAVGAFEYGSTTWAPWPRLVLTVLVGLVVYLPVLWLLAGRELRTLAASLRDARKHGPKRQKGQKGHRRAALAAGVDRTVGEADAQAMDTTSDPDAMQGDVLPSPIPGLPGHPDNVQRAEHVLLAALPDEAAPATSDLTPLDRLARGGAPAREGTEGAGPRVRPRSGPPGPD